VAAASNLSKWRLETIVVGSVGGTLASVAGTVNLNGLASLTVNDAGDNRRPRGDDRHNAVTFAGPGHRCITPV